MILLQHPVVLLMSISTFLLMVDTVRADFATGTITFDETSYIVYDSDGSVYSGVGATENASTNAFFQTSGGLTRVESGGSLSHYTLTMQDGAVVPYDAYFKTGDVYVRFAFDSSSGSASGSIDSGDLSAVIERTYHSTKFELDGDVFAYTALANDTRDYVQSGYEDQAGDFFVRAFKGSTSGTSTDTSFTHDNINGSWDSFIIEYSTTNGATVDSATGEIWDIDGGSTQAERFAVTATTTLETSTVNSPTGVPLADSSSLDGLPWQWSFSGLSGSITKIEFARFGDGTGTDGYKSFFPLAFNNFNPVSSVGFTTATPEPSSVLAFCGIVSLAVLRRRRRSATCRISSSTHRIPPSHASNCPRTMPSCQIASNRLLGCAILDSVIPANAKHSVGPSKNKQEKFFLGGEVRKSHSSHFFE